MIWITVALGFFLANGFSLSKISILFFTLLGSGLCAAGAFIINQYMEIDVDTKMDRTKNRPFPTERINPDLCLLISVVLIVGGSLLLWSQVNLLTSWLTLLIVISYDLLYTPMKRFSWLNTTIGAFPGAIPPMLGWTAYTNNLGIEAWILFAILFMWQHPHFFAIGWLYRKDYKQGNIKLVSTLEETGLISALNAVFYAVLLIPISMAPSLQGLSGKFYLYGAGIISLFYLFKSVLFLKKPNEFTARRLLYASFVYIPAIALCFYIDSYLVQNGIY